MAIDAQRILDVLDSCNKRFDFPMLDNGYVYLAATRLSLYSAPDEWAMVIEVFGFSPRAGLPDTCIYTFASTVCNREIPAGYGPREISVYLANNPNNDTRFLFPIEPGSWQDAENVEYVANQATELLMRGRVQLIPRPEECALRGITIEEPPRMRTFELCRYLADLDRESVLATPTERRLSLLPSLTQILQLEEWNHPNVVDSSERPSQSETFQQLAHVLATGNIDLYQPSQPPNTHWRNWPDGGLL